MRWQRDMDLKEDIYLFRLLSNSEVTCPQKYLSQLYSLIRWKKYDKSKNKTEG